MNFINEVHDFIKKPNKKEFMIYNENHPCKCEPQMQHIADHLILRNAGHIQLVVWIHHRIHCISLHYGLSKKIYR